MMREFTDSVAFEERKKREEERKSFAWITGMNGLSWHEVRVWLKNTYAKKKRKRAHTRRKREKIAIPKFDANKYNNK